MVTNLPEFLCIGVQKAATSWLWVQLRSHPDIWMPPVKELHFFDHLFVPENRKWTGWHIKTHVGKTIKWHRDNGKDRGPYFDYLQGLLAEDMFTEEWYRRAYSLPAAKKKMTGDITPEYCMITDKGVEYVRNLLGDVKIMIMVRDPVDRALSQIRMNAKNRKVDLESASLDEWMALAQDPVVYSRARYSEFVPLWTDTFGKKSVLLLQYSLVANEPLEVLRAAERFLRLPAYNYGEPARRVHESANKQIQPPDEIVRHLQNETAVEAQFLRAMSS